MTEAIILTMLALWWASLLVFGVWGDHIKKLRCRKKAQARLQQIELDRIDARLWELLKDEDPHWLSMMGITEPKLEDQGYPYWSGITNTPGAVIPVRRPGDVTFVSPKRDYARRQFDPNPQWMVPVVPRATELDRHVERLLERRLNQ